MPLRDVNPIFTGLSITYNLGLSINLDEETPSKLQACYKQLADLRKQNPKLDSTQLILLLETDLMK